MIKLLIGGDVCPINRNMPYFIAGNARRELEEKSGKTVVTSSNFLNQLNKNEEIELIEKE